ncbi:hypothetical protein ABVV53_07805 [Novosphingobium sp. RD2P27]|uniref:Uncharacterized protein n=1 Tax=Novosphingobium kalidii TaxID=3230299 RepID=A0ABV2D0I7_9SPHN
MVQSLSHLELNKIAVVTTAPVRTRVDRNFGLPTALYVATVALYLAFIGVMGTTFMNPELAIPVVIFAGFVAFGFGLAGYWAKMKPHNDTSPLSWSQFTHGGIETMTGRLTARQAAVQVLILPVLITVWALVIATIVALT